MVVISTTCAIYMYVYIVVTVNVTYRKLTISHVAYVL